MIRRLSVDDFPMGSVRGAVISRKAWEERGEAASGREIFVHYLCHLLKLSLSNINT